jgi:flavin-dependent dehydrogenase
MTGNNATQVVVIGGGPAGSTVSTLLAQQGVRVELFERERFPRFHIGESLIPETYWVFKRLNMLDKMKASHFIKKHSVQFVSAKGKVSTPFYFFDNKPHECSQTWQVVRSEFDEMMLKNAEEHGVQVHQGARVLDVLFEGDRAVGVEVVESSGGTTRRVLADVVVDASGQSSLIINKFGLRVADPVLNKGAIWTYFEGAYRDQGKDEGATLVLQTKEKKAWFWYIPQHNNIVSVGVVADFKHLFTGRGDHETTFMEEVDECPILKDRISIGKRATRFYATKDYTYRSSRAAGDGWVLVGDAFGFLDPLYSSGVLLALRSGELAADCIAEGLASGDTSSAQLGKWSPDFVQGMNRMRRLVCEYYDGFSFGKFVRRFPHLQGSVTDLLIGDLFKDDLDEVFASIDLLREEAMAGTKHD